MGSGRHLFLVLRLFFSDVLDDLQERHDRVVKNGHQGSFVYQTLKTIGIPTFRLCFFLADMLIFTEEEEMERHGKKRVSI